LQNRKVVLEDCKRLFDFLLVVDEEAGIEIYSDVFLECFLDVLWGLVAPFSPNVRNNGWRFSSSPSSSCKRVGLVFGWNPAKQTELVVLLGT
jgi:hypothetical protein